jgi:integrase/recombinase XerD
MYLFKYCRCIDKKCKYRRQVRDPYNADPCKRCGGKTVLSKDFLLQDWRNGKKVIENAGSNKKRAEDGLGKRRGQKGEGRILDIKKTTSWEKATKAFKEWVEESELAPGTRRMYEGSIETLTPHFEHLMMDEITIPHLTTFRGVRRKQGLKPASINRELATMKRLCNLCVDWGMLDFYRLKKLKLYEEKPRIRFLTAAEMKKLIEKCIEEWLRIAVLIALQTGLRKSNVLKLNRAEVSFKTREIYVTVKGGNKISVPIPKKAIPKLKTYLKSIPDSQWFFPSPVNPDTHRAVESHRAWDSAVKASKIKNFRFHDLRHTFATHYLAERRNLLELKELLGHAKVETTEKYAHILKEKKHEGTEAYGVALDAILR